MESWKATLGAENSAVTRKILVGFCPIQNPNPAPFLASRVSEIFHSKRGLKIMTISKWLGLK